MLTIVKISGKSGYEPENNFCIVRDVEKYQNGALYVCKVLNRFQDAKGNDHFVVKPISDPVEEINYDIARKILSGHDDGISFLESKGHLSPEYEYDEAVQNYFTALSQTGGCANAQVSV